MMKMDEVFKDRLTDFRQIPQGDVWLSIVGQLSEQKKWKRRKQQRVWLSAAASLVLVATLSVWWLSQLNFMPEMDLEPIWAETSKQQQLLHSQLKLVEEKNISALVATPIEKEGSYKEILVLAPEQTKRQSPISPLEPLAVVDVPQIPGKRVKKAYLAIMSNIPIATDRKPKERKQVTGKRLFVSGFVAPTYSYRFLTSASGTVDQQVKYFNGVEEGLKSYAGGVHFGYKLSNRLALYSGLSYHRMGQQLNYVDVYVNNAYEAAGFVPNNQYEVMSSLGAVELNTGYYFEDDTHVRIDYASRNKFNINSNSAYFGKVGGDIQQVSQYLSVPVHMHYRVMGKPGKLHFDLVGGLNFSLLLGSEVSLKTEGERVALADTEKLTQFGMQGVLGVAMAYPLRNGLEFRLQPTFSTFIKPVNPGNQTLSRPYEFALQTGFAFAL